MLCEVHVPSRLQGKDVYIQSVSERLAERPLQVGLDHLRDDALAHIQRNLTEHNILKELSCSIVARSVLVHL